MAAFTLKSLDTSERPATGSLVSLVFHVAFPEHVPRQFLQLYRALRTERGMDEDSHYEAASGQLALEVYNGDIMRSEREAWTKRAASVFQDLVATNKTTLRHIELILPTGGIATPLNLLRGVKDVVNLESWSIQWVRMH
jgi:hypothetical protein